MQECTRTSPAPPAGPGLPSFHPRARPPLPRSFRAWRRLGPATSNPPPNTRIATEPRSYRVWWWLVIVAAVATGWIEPYQIAFLSPTPRPLSAVVVLQFVLLGVFLGDILLSFFVGFYERVGSRAAGAGLVERLPWAARGRGCLSAAFERMGGGGRAGLAPGAAVIEGGRDPGGGVLMGHPAVHVRGRPAMAGRGPQGLSAGGGRRALRPMPPPSAAASAVEWSPGVGVGGWRGGGA
jgi:hypothetical protein